jgi:transcription elongation factor Elf1
MQSDTAIIKCVQCGAQLIVPDYSEYVDEYRVRHIWKCEPCGYVFEATIASRRRGVDACESHTAVDLLIPEKQALTNKIGLSANDHSRNRALLGAVPIQFVRAISDRSARARV